MVDDALGRLSDELDARRRGELSGREHHRIAPVPQHDTQPLADRSARLAVPGADEVADLVEREPEVLRAPYEPQPGDLRLVVDPVAPRRPRRIDRSTVGGARPATRRLPP